MGLEVLLHQPVAVSHFLSPWEQDLGPKKRITDITTTYYHTIVYTLTISSF